jgi:hypothetical protein
VEVEVPVAGVESPVAAFASIRVAVSAEVLRSECCSAPQTLDARTSRRQCVVEETGAATKAVVGNLIVGTISTYCH